MRQNFTIGCSYRRSTNVGFLLSIVSLLSISTRDFTCHFGSRFLEKYTRGPSLILPIKTPEDVLSLKDSIIKLFSDNTSDKSPASARSETGFIIESLGVLPNLKTGRRFLIESVNNITTERTMAAVNTLITIL